MNTQDRLNSLIANQTIPHALLFVGKEEAKKAAYYFSTQIIQEKVAAQHPDLHIFLPEGKTMMHSLKSLQEFSKEAVLAPFRAKKKVLMIHDAERMLATSANALLKILEEPPASTIILLLSPFPERILSTIRSRVQVFEFSSETSYPQEVLDLLSNKISKEEFAQHCEEKMLTDLSFFYLFFETILLWFRDRLLLEWGEEGKPFLTFLSLASDVQKSPLQSLEKVEKTLNLVKKGIERSIKFSICLEILNDQIFTPEESFNRKN